MAARRPNGVRWEVPGALAPFVSMLLRKEDVEMRSEFDFSPLFRSSVGFDRMFDLLQHATRGGVDGNYPPYDIERTGEDSYRVTLAVAGFKPDDLNVVAQQNMLVVSGDRRHQVEANGGSDQQRQVLHRGIAGRSFERRFELADHVKVVGADLADGLLTIDLKREVPEAMRPRRIEIAGAGGGNVLRGPQPQRQVEGQAQVA
jgi:molecular chaperone IbpA